MKLNRFVRLSFLLPSLFPLFPLLLVSGRRLLDDLPRLDRLELSLTPFDDEKAGSASGAGDPGVSGAV